MRRALVTLSLAAVSLAGEVLASDLSPSEERGKQLFITGKSASGNEVLAFLESSKLELPASTLTCVGCHGYDGRGRPEGGVQPSNITWPALTKTFSAVRADGREHPPYDEKSLLLAITLGVDPAGNPLDVNMPRYRLSINDAADLVAYLKKLSNDQDPGISATELVLGTVLPPGRERADVVRQTLQEAFDAINRGGAVFGRTLRLVTLEAGASGGPSAAEVGRFLDREKPFALVGPYLSGAEEEVVSLLVERQVPAVGALGFDPRLVLPPRRQVFYLHAGISGEAIALAKHWIDGGGRAKVAIAASELTAQAAEAVRSWLESKSIDARVISTTGPGSTGWDGTAFAQRCKSEGLGTVVFLRPGGDLASFLAAARAGNTRPLVLASATLSGGAVTQPATGFTGQLRVALPFLPMGPATGPIGPSSARHAVARSLATAAVRILVEALQKNGRELSRERLIVALEGLYRYETGVSRPLSYGPNHRIGMNGAYVLEVDPESGRLADRADWVELED